MTQHEDYVTYDQLTALSGIDGLSGMCVINIAIISSGPRHACSARIGY